MSKESVAGLNAEFPEFKVYWWVARGKRVYAVDHLPSGCFSRCSLSSLASVRHLIENYEKEKNFWGYWSRPGEKKGD